MSRFARVSTSERWAWARRFICLRRSDVVHMSADMWRNPGKMISGGWASAKRRRALESRLTTSLRTSETPTDGRKRVRSSTRPTVTMCEVGRIREHHPGQRHDPGRIGRIKETNGAGGCVWGIPRSSREHLLLGRFRHCFPQGPSPWAFPTALFDNSRILGDSATDYFSSNCSQK